MWFKFSRSFESQKLERTDCASSLLAVARVVLVVLVTVDRVGLVSVGVVLDVVLAVLEEVGEGDKEVAELNSLEVTES